MEDETPALTSDHIEIIEQYFSNGFNGTKAVKEIRPQVTTGSAAVIWSEIKNSDTGQAYIKERQTRLRATAEIRMEQVLRELLNYIYIDITDFIGLTEEEIKLLPPEVKRCIQSFKAIERTTIDKKGQKNITKTIEIKIADKLKAIDMINKHIGLYEADNTQKANRVQVLQVLQRNDPDTLNKLLKAMEQTED